MEQMPEKKIVRKTGNLAKKGQITQAILDKVAVAINMGIYSPRAQAYEPKVSQDGATYIQSTRGRGFKISGDDSKVISIQLENSDIRT